MQQSQAMNQFQFVFTTKSDGLDIVNIKNRPVRNGPSEEQLNDKANAQGQKDYYREILKDDAKHIDWRKKLGGMLLREMGGKPYEDKWTSSILYDLPENYKLYEHVKTKADGQLKTVKNHSGGGHDRQDAYLYGYPKGPKKRFRSPVEFFPHLLWLNTDDNNDSANCTCKMCSPAGDVEKPQVKQEVKTEQPVVIKRDMVSAPAPGRRIVHSNPVVQIPVRRPSSGPPAPSSGAKPTTPVATPQPTPAQQTRAPPYLQSTPLPQPRSIEQQIDLAYNRFLCRTGEVVWFYRPTTSAWGLGLVIRRWAPKDQSAQRSYLVQPLSHPFETPPQEVVHTDDYVKPWLAWSAPNCTFAYLQQNPQYEYGTVDWQAMASGRYGEGLASVDASILAAKAIDSTYTLFERLKTSENEKGDEITSYNGIYLGAEKIWRGEALRLRIGTTGSDLLVITDIVEQVFRDPGVDQPHSKVVVVGDIYSYATLDAPDPRNPPNPPQQNNNIPSRMAHDMAWRNSYLIPQTRTMAWWKLISPSYKLPLDEIKGRWYETSLVFQEPFTKAVKNGEGGNGIWMNSRGDATAKGKHTGVNQADRIAAFGASVPKGTRLVEGLDPPLQGFGQVQHDSDTTHVNMGGTGGGTATSDPFSIDEFMHVDHLGDDTGMEFGGNNGFTF